MGNLGAPELLIIAVVIVLLFGSKKLPEMARALGRSAKILKAETTGTKDVDHGGQTSQPARFSEPATPASAPLPGAPASFDHEPEADRIQRQIEDLQRQLTIAQQAQLPKHAD